YIRVCDLNLLRSKCNIIGDPKQYPLNETPLVERTTPVIRDKDHANSHHVEEPPTSKQKQDHVGSLLNEDIDDVAESPTSIQNPSISTQKCSSHSPTSKQKQDRVDPSLNENIDDGRHVEEPPTSKQNPPASTQKCSFHSLTQNKTNTIMGVNLTPGAITKIMTDKCSSTDLKPVVQVTNILSGRIRIGTKNDKQYYSKAEWSKAKLTMPKVLLSDGSSSHFGRIADDIFIPNKLQKGSIIQLTKFHFTNFSTYGDIRVLLINDLNVIHRKCDIIVNPEPFPRNDIPLLERSTPLITDEDHVDVSQAQEHVTSTQNCSETQSRKRKHHLSNETPESDTNEDVDNSQNAQEPTATTQKCFSHSLTQSKKQKHQSSNDNISTAVEDVSKMMMEKNKQDDVGACFKKLERLDEDVSIMARMMTIKNKEDDVGACFKKLETLEEVVSKLTRMLMEKNKDDVDACLEKLGILEEDVSKLARMMMEKNKEDDVCACFKKLETLEKDISKMTKTISEKNKQDDVGACFKKLETLEDDVCKMTRMMMEKNKEDDMGACIEKLDKMGWGAEEPIYDTALLLFGQSADYRKLWLHLKPESCGKWVKNAGKVEPSSYVVFWVRNAAQTVWYLKFINNLENEVMNVSMEKEQLKIELMRAQAMINILQSRVDKLTKENNWLRRGG
ncbi:L10-interacting MYB domain-containing protein-like protein, partial [Tanacetum coccineum]